VLEVSVLVLGVAGAIMWVVGKLLGRRRPPPQHPVPVPVSGEDQQTVAGLMETGREVGATWFLRSNYRLSLQSALDTARLLRSGARLPETWAVVAEGLDPVLRDQVTELARQGKRAQALRTLRAGTGLRLIETRDLAAALGV
jgi:hypothetical protein